MNGNIKKHLQAIAAVLIMALTAVSSLTPAAAESYTASTMRLLHYEGDIEITDASGASRFIMENVRFASGENLKQVQYPREGSAFSGVFPFHAGGIFHAKQPEMLQICGLSMLFEGAENGR